MHIIRSETLGRRLASVKSLAQNLAKIHSETLGETFGETSRSPSVSPECRMGWYAWLSARLSSRLVFLRGYVPAKSYQPIIIRALCVRLGSNVGYSVASSRSRLSAWRTWVILLQTEQLFWPHNWYSPWNFFFTSEHKINRHVYQDLFEFFFFFFI